MRRIQFLLIPILLACLLVVGCTTDKAWRNATTLSFEALGIGIEGSKSVTESLRAGNYITDEQVNNVKATYNKARAIYKSMGDSLKLASAADTEAKKDIALQDYSKLLTQFNQLVLEITNLINSFSKKKVSSLDVQKWIEEGGTL